MILSLMVKTWTIISDVNFKLEMIVSLVVKTWTIISDVNFKL